MSPIKATVLHVYSVEPAPHNCQEHATLVDFDYIVHDTDGKVITKSQYQCEFCNYSWVEVTK